MPAAQANIFDDMNSSYFANVSFVTYDESLYVPDQAVQSSGNIKGWIDVVGFRDVVKMGGIDYINGSPSDKAMVQYASWAVITVPICSSSIQNSMTKTISGSNTVASLSVKLVWESKHCGRSGCTCVEHTEFTTFSDSEPSPIQYPAPDCINLTIHEYSNKKVIYFNKSKWITGYNLTTRNGSVSEIKAGNLEHTSKDVPYVNFTAPQVITNLSGKMNRFGDGYMMENASFSTQFYTPYYELNLSQNITVIKHESTSIQPFMFYFVFIVAVILFGIKRMVNLCRI